MVFIEEVFGQLRISAGDFSREFSLMNRWEKRRDNAFFFFFLRGVIRYLGNKVFAYYRNLPAATSGGNFLWLH